MNTILLIIQIILWILLQVYTQNIERLWRDMRSGPLRYRMLEKRLKHYLAELFFFKRQYNFNEQIP